jgi:hypothetical protein
MGRLILVDDALACRFVEFFCRAREGGESGILVALGDRVAHSANDGFQLAFDRFIALAGFLVCSDPLYLRLNIRHVHYVFRLWWPRSWTTR